MMENVSCISPESNRASDAYRMTAFTTVVVTVVIILSGGVFWWNQRKSVWLRRRNPAIVWLGLVPVISVTFSGSFYRWYLNDPGSIFGECFLVNFFFLLSVPSFIIPNTARIMNFHFRLKLHEKLAKLHNIYNDEDVGTIHEDTGFVGSPPQNAVFFRSRMKRSALGSFETEPLDEAPVVEIRRLCTKAGSKFAFKLALGLLMFTFICAIVYSMISCDVFAEDQSECEFGSTDGINFILLMSPVVLAFGLYLYFRCKIVSRTPDPFAIKAEIDVFMLLLIAGFVISLLNLIDPANFSKKGDKSDEEISFKWIQLMDVIGLLGLLNSIHFQTYKAWKFGKTSSSAYPMTIQEILGHPEGCNLFKVFLQTDFSVENLVLYKLISNWKSNYDRVPQLQSDLNAKEIFKSWLDISQFPDGGIMNVSAKCIEILTRVFAEEGPYGEAVFDEVLDEILDLMQQDSFTRFIRTSEYLVFVGAQDPEKLSQIA